jgi:hypothetical protein
MQNDSDTLHFFGGMLVEDNRRKVLLFVFLNECVLFLVANFVLGIPWLDRGSWELVATVSLIFPLATWTLLLSARWLILKATLSLHH